MKRIARNVFGIAALGVLAFTMFAASASAAAPQRAQTLCEGAGGVWSKDTCSHKSEQSGGLTLEDLLKTTVQVVLYVIAAVAVVMLIIGSLKYVTSGGDQNSVKSAKNTILYAVIGIVFAVAAFGIVRFVAEGFRAY